MQNKNIFSNKLNWLIAGLLLILVVVLDYLSPSEKTLGQFVKLVYLHASLIFSTLSLFIVSLLFIAAGFIYKKNKYLLKGKRIFITSAIIWAVNLLFSMINMKLIWGAIAWQEPKFTAMVTVVFILIIGFSISTFFNNLKIKSIIYSISTVIVFGSIFLTSNIIHPNSPIKDSPSLAIKLFPVAMTFLLFLAGLLVSQALDTRRFIRNND